MTETHSDAPPRARRPAEPSVADIREGARALLARALSAACPGRGETEAYGPESPAVLDLERALHAEALKSQRRATLRQNYADSLFAVISALPLQSGPFPEDVPSVAYASGRQTAEETIKTILGREGDGPDAARPDERETIRRMFTRILIGALPEYDAHRDRTLEIARALEVSCYNATVRASKESEEPPRRQWSSPAFVNIYSARCGTIAGLLDPASGPCVAYGARLARQLWDGEVRPEQVGAMVSKELCPEATAAERDEIRSRSAQRVVQKESNLFRCPHCGARRCTYREVQRRSLDEAPDYLCVCLECKRRFNGRN